MMVLKIQRMKTILTDPYISSITFEIGTSVWAFSNIRHHWSTIQSVCLKCSIRKTVPWMHRIPIFPVERDKASSIRLGERCHGGVTTGLHDRCIREIVPRKGERPKNVHHK